MRALESIYNIIEIGKIIFKEKFMLLYKYIILLTTKLLTNA